MHDISVEEFPSVVPDSRDLADLEKLLIATIDKLPKSNIPLVHEISHAMISSKE